MKRGGARRLIWSNHGVNAGHLKIADPYWHTRNVTRPRDHQPVLPPARKWLGTP